MWSIRGNPNVKKVFAQIWQTSELLVSFDAAGCFRDWHLNPTWKTTSGWYHCDQNPSEKSDRCSVQGFVSLTDNNEFTGGLVIVPQSHKHFNELQSLGSSIGGGLNYVGVKATHPIFEQFQPRLVKCKAGDLVVFDSRCIHCNTPAFETDDRANDTEPPRLLRIVSYVCMSPAAMVPAESLEKFRETREECVAVRVSCTHWPAELHLSGGPQLGDRRPLRLSGYQKSLIIGTDVDPDGEKAKEVTDV